MSRNGKENNGCNQSKPLKTLAGAEDKPLIVSGAKITCYVLEDETRVISERGFNESLGTSSGGKSGSAVDSALMPRIAQAKWLKPFIPDKLKNVLSSPIEFTPPHGGRTAYGYPALSFVDLCEAILKARDNNAVPAQQDPIVWNADLILRGLARVGITALIDEATGYQRIRVERALARILEKFIAEEMQPWMKTYPIEFYEQICRLKGWPAEHAIARPQVVGHYTNDIIYDRLAPGVLEELRNRNPTLPSGNRRHRHHQHLTPNHGHPALQRHIEGVIALMRVSESWEKFMVLLEKAYPKPVEALPLFAKLAEKSGQGTAKNTKYL